MSMKVRNNGSSSMLAAGLSKHRKEAVNHLTKVATEMKINSAGDGASEYSISERMRSKMRGLDQALSNTQTSSNLIKRASEAVNDQIDIMQRVHTLAIKASDDTCTDEDRAILQKETYQVLTQLDNIARETTYNGMQLLDQKVNAKNPDENGNYCQPEYTMTFHTGGRPSHTINLTLHNTTLNMLFPSSSEHWKIQPEESDYPAELSLANTGNSSVSSAPSAGSVAPGSSGFIINPGGNSNSASSISEGLSALREEWQKSSWPYPARTVNLDPKNCLENRDAAKTFLADADQALKYLLHVNTELGAQSARMEYTGNNLVNQTHMMESADSEIRDANLAEETLNYAKSNILVSSSESLLAQSNQSAGSVTGLLIK